MHRNALTTLAIAFALAAPALAASPAKRETARVDPGLLAGMAARSIGPAAMSGRIAAIDAVAADPDQVWVGSATGGVWKSENAGLTWEPVFDDQPVAAIGAVAIDQANPEVVWVGTGEGNPRNSVSVGNGLYKTVDGGRTWKHLGLEKTERIHRIVLDPTDPRVAYVAALGQAWGENPERGVFKTVDGGATWRKVLYVDERTGAADLVMDPGNPNKLFAAMWDYRRWPWAFRSGGPGSGLYVTHDGGASWKEITEDDGLPKGDLGRIGLGISRSDPRIVYALVEAKETALVRSEDGGRTWKIVNSDADVSPRPFYFGDIRVDPADPHRVYRLAVTVDVSEDGGKSFDTLIAFNDAHPDHHALWIHPGDAGHMYDGNDGGVYVSRDRGRSWNFAGNLPLAQFYHVRYDLETPYNVYGGLQDNGSWKGPSAVWETGDIGDAHWQELGFGDGFDTAPDPRDPMRGYAMSQEGHLLRWDLRTGERKDIRPAPAPGTELRFNWNAALAVDPFEPSTVYYGSQFVHKSTDRGDTWTVASPDLTTNRPEWQKQAESGGVTLDVTGAENFTTILALAPSPVARGVLWAGTDDGRLHVTRDGGGRWESVEGNVRGVPANTWIPHIAPSPHDAATAFVVFDDHRRSNWTPYVYRTTDYGRTWKSLATPDLRGYALSIVQDPVDPDLLFLGTEFGLWASLDGGASWLPWKHGVPTVSVMDLAIHPRDHDLIVATHGRALYVLDDVAPLRTLSAETMKAPVHLFPVPDALQHRNRQTAGARFPGSGAFQGENEPYGALLTYSLNAPGLPLPEEEKERARKEEERRKARGEASAEKRRPEMSTEEVKKEESVAPGKAAEVAEGEEGPGEGQGKKPQAEIKVLDASGKVIRTFKEDATLGVNRAVWDLRRDAYKKTSRPGDSPFRRPRGPEVLPGTYTVRVSYGGKTAEAPVRVLADPRLDPQTATAARAANSAAVERAAALQEKTADAIERVTQAKADIDAILARVKAREDERKKREATTETAPAVKDLQKEGRRVKERLGDVEKKLWISPQTHGRPAETDLENRIDYVTGSLSSTWDAPTPAHLAYLDQAQALAKEILAEVNRVFAEDVAAFRAKVQAADRELLARGEPLGVE